MTRILCGDAVANKLAMVPLSNVIIKQRIQEFTESILKQTIASVKLSGKFSLQLHETTDIGNDAQVMVFVRCCDTNDFVEQFLFCRPLAKNFIGEKIFQKEGSFFREQQLECVFCADVAPSMIRSRKGFVSFVKKKNMLVVHFLLHRENLAAKEIK